VSHNPFEMRRPATALLSAAIAVALYGMPLSVRAQNAADAPATAQTKAEETATESATTDDKGKNATEMEEIVVSFSQSLMKALDEKRSATGQVDVIVAEDIGKFPDLNLAESLQRIPGVAIARDAGEGRNISVRGLGPGFSRVRINGMEALTTTGGTDSSGGANRGRGFDFNVFASELFNTLAVRKTSSAEVEEGSLGATVDLTVARPFDYQDFTFVVSGQGGYNDLSDEFDPRAAMLISNTFADGTLGALLSVAYSQRNLSEEGFSTAWASPPRCNGSRHPEPC
jgi:iron complex outermembrane receptor protein